MSKLLVGKCIPIISICVDKQESVHFRSKCSNVDCGLDKICENGIGGLDKIDILKSQRPPKLVVFVILCSQKKQTYNTEIIRLLNLDFTS